MLRAFFVAPVGAAAVYAALFLIDPMDRQSAIIGALWIAALVGTVSYLAEALIAWPAFLLLRRVGWAGPVVQMSGGLMLGVLLAAVFDLPELNFVRWRYYATAALSGACSGAVFSYMLFWRPNRRLQPTAAGAISNRRG